MVFTGFTAIVQDKTDLETVDLLENNNGQLLP
jgi:hypothetical protein